MLFRRPLNLHSVDDGLPTKGLQTINKSNTLHMYTSMAKRETMASPVNKQLYSLKWIVLLQRTSDTFTTTKKN